MASHAPLRLFDTASGLVKPLTLRSPGRVSMYVCGPTVYGPAHVGHGRFSLVFDVIRRYLVARGLEVTYVSNITDVDDKILAKAAAEGTTPQEVARRYEASWRATMDLLGVQEPDVTPHATEYVTLMLDVVERLLERGHAYLTRDGVYFDSTSVEGYGLLAHQDLSELRAGQRVELGEKRASTDFVLWKLTGTEDLHWDSPWGPGRPGWHTECVAMSLDVLGPGFDLHGGGQDLAFPHHEDERAQALGLGAPFASHWVHNGFVVDRDARRIGKSMGNAVDLPTLLAGADPRAYRLLVLQSHYRSPLVADPRAMADASEALARLDGFNQRLTRLGTGAVADPGVLESWHEALDDDLGTHVGVAGLFDVLRRANSAFDAGDLDLGTTLGRAVVAALAEVGLLLSAARTPSEDDLELVVRRDAARSARDWVLSDAIRAELSARGWKVADTPAGTVLS
jgi:cysteinyl-tRNA synthetase